MEYLKAWIWKQINLSKQGEEIDETLLKYVQKLHNQLEGLLSTKLIKRTKSGNFELAELADLQVENRMLKNEVISARELLSNSQPFVSTMRLDIYKNKKENFIKRNKHVEI